MLKNILSLLLSRFYSKKDATEIAALALPKHSGGIDISITEGTNTYIAPADGYINFITARNGGVNVFGQCLQTNSYPSTNRQAKAFVPISKGKKISFEIGGETISATFYKLIGGGKALKNALLQGGGLCLNSLSSSLRRSSWLARSLGSATSLKPSYLAARIFPTPPALTNKITQLQVMELYALMSRVQNGLSCALRQIILGEFCNTLLSKKTLLSKLFSLSQRVRLSLSMSRLKEPPLVSSSFRPLVLNEVKGGASC